MRHSTRFVGAAAVVSLTGALAACGGHSHAAPAAATVAAPPAAAVEAKVERLEPAAFAKRLKATEGLVVNVHVPDEGEIPGTDVHIPYLSVAISEELPADKATELLIYCRTGHMSAEAAQSLLAAGRTHVVELAGGFEAWKASGRKLTPGPA